jgi:hypothetical protein
VDRSTTSGHASERGDRGRRGALLGVRVVLPVAIALAGVILMTVGAGSVAALGALLVGIAGLVVLVNVLARMSISSQSDRESRGARPPRVSAQRALAARRAVSSRPWSLVRFCSCFWSRWRSSSLRSG